MNPELLELLLEVEELLGLRGRNDLAAAIRVDVERAYREGLKDGYETAKGIYDHTGRAA